MDPVFQRLLCPRWAQVGRAARLARSAPASWPAVWAAALAASAVCCEPAHSGLKTGEKALNPKRE